MKTVLVSFFTITIMLSGVSARGDFIVSPHLTRDPNAAGPLPFLVDSASASSLRNQQVFGATDFAALTIPVWITEISYSRVPGSLHVDVNLPDVRIDLSTTARNPDGLSPVFANNVGINNTVVFSGPLHIFDNPSEEYGVHIVLQNPFLYDPRGGNLLVDIRNYDTISPPASGMYAFWGEITSGDSVSSAGTDNVNASSGFIGTSGFVTRFTVVAVPNPALLRWSSLALFRWPFSVGNAVEPPRDHPVEHN